MGVAALKDDFCRDALRNVPKAEMEIHKCPLDAATPKMVYKQRIIL
jgi:hypothetical protein